MSVTPAQVGTYTGDDVKSFVYPNPVASGISLKIRCSIPASKAGCTVNIKVFALTGELVRDIKLVDDMGTSMSALTGNQSHDFVWNLKNDAGEPVASGVYMYMVYANNEPQKSAVKKIAVVR
jgi:flagellar hook assembly protein FlgD